MRPARVKAPSLLWLALLGAVLSFFGANVGRLWDFTVDDAGITYAYARNAAAGHGLVLTPGSERVEAATNLLWVLLLMPAEALHTSHEQLSKVLGLVFGAGALAAVAFFPSAAYARKPRYFDLAAPFAAASFAHMALWTASGLENGLFTFLAALSVTLAAWEEANLGRFPWSSVALGLLFAARPDGALYAAAVGLAKLTRVARRKLTRQDVLWALFLGVGVGALELFRLAYFAWPVPNSFYTKQRTFDFGQGLADFRSAGWNYLGSWVRAYGLTRALVVAPAVLLARRAQVARVALLAAVAAGLFLPVYSHGDWMEEWRFLTYVTPLLCLAVGEALRAIIRLPLNLVSAPPRRWAAAPLAVLAAWALWALTTHGYPARFNTVRRHTTLPFSMVRARAHYFATAARALDLRGASVLDPDVGGMAYDSGLGVVDLYGLGDVAIARTHTSDEPGLREAIFFERRPTFVHLHGAWFGAVMLDRLEELEGLYLPLPSAIGSEHDSGSDYVRRESLAAPWTEEAERGPALAARGEGYPDGYTLSADGLDPGHPLVVEMTFANAARATLGELTATPEPAGTPALVAVRMPTEVVPTAAFFSGERPWTRARLPLAAGRYVIRWRSDLGEATLGTVVVARGAGAQDVAAARGRLEAAVAAGRMHDARREALRLALRRHDAPDDAGAREALDLYAHALATRADAAGALGAYAVAADLAREARRFSSGDAAAHALVQRLAERMADASRHAAQRREAAAAFTLARDSVLIDPRRSWMRRRAEEFRQRRRSEYDGGRDLAAYRTAAAAAEAPGGPSYDAALALLGSVSRWVEAAALVDRVGAPPQEPRARLAAARGYLARGELAEAFALASTVPCATARDVDFARAFRALAGRPYRPGDALCELDARAAGDPPWSAGVAPFDANEGSFESGTFAGWTVEGRAFGPSPLHERLAEQTFVNGWRGRWYASSYARSADASTGLLRSRPFTITTDAISFLVGGGGDTAKVGVRLLVDGAVVLRAAGDNDEALRRAFWDVRRWRGHGAVIEVYDDAGAGWGHVLADDFVAEPAMPATAAATPAFEVPPTL